MTAPSGGFEPRHACDTYTELKATWIKR